MCVCVFVLVLLVWFGLVWFGLFFLFYISIILNVILILDCSAYSNTKFKV